MDPTESYDSLDKQVNDTFRQRPAMGFLKRTAAAATAALVLLAGCMPRYEIMHIRSPDAIPQKISDYGKRMDSLAEQMKLYDSKTGNYDFGRIKSEAEKQTATKEYTDPKTKEKITTHPNLRDYDSIDKLYATKRVLERLIEQNKGYIEANKNDSSKQSEVTKRFLDNEELNKLRGRYDSALREYDLVSTGNPKKSEEEREKSSLALEVGEFSSKDFRSCEELAKKRRQELGILGPSKLYDEVAMRDPEGVREAHKIHNQMLAERRRRNGKIGFWSAIGAALIYALCHDDDGTGIPGGIGGEDGGIGGR